jgi:hypothetical protein
LRDRGGIEREGCQNSDSSLNRGFDTFHDYKGYENTREAKRLDEHLAAGAPSTIPR